MKLNKSGAKILEMVKDNPKYELVLTTNGASVQTKDGSIVQLINQKTWDNLYWGRFIDTNGKIFGASFYKINDKGREALSKSGTNGR